MLPCEKRDSKNLQVFTCKEGHGVSFLQVSGHCENAVQITTVCSYNLIGVLFKKKGGKKKHIHVC